MATYFHGGSEIQADNLQTLYLMNPNNYGYSDTQQPMNMFFLNSASTPHAPPQQSQNFFGIPLPAAASTAIGSDDPTRQPMHEIPVLHGMVPRFHYNSWGPHDQTPAGTHPHISSTVAAAAGNRAVAPPHSQRGLSLSLSPQTRPYNRPIQTEHEIPVSANVAVVSPMSGDVSAMTNGIGGLQSVILGSKYLKAAQKLLDEVVSVGKGPMIKIDSVEGNKKEIKGKMSRESTAVMGGEGSSGGGVHSGGSKHGGGELTTAQRQEFQMKKAKLINMLDEVEQRYRQYHNQMQIVAASFEQVAGLGSAKSYTALALQTISKQFRCLKDAISAQIKATSKSLGEEDCLGGKIEGSRLKFVDQQLRQQRAFQQLGMIQNNNAWRPQRGLPERAVSVLRAWLFEHFLHPYPKDSDKHLLAKQTGLTRSQVSNWFINARVRLWKPMVEEMYTEEVKDQEQIGSEDNTSKPEPKNESGSKSIAHKEISTHQSQLEKPTNNNPPQFEISSSIVSTSPLERSIQPQPGFSLVGSSDMEWIVQRSSKKQRNSEMNMKSSETSKGNEKQIGDAYQLLAGTEIHASGFGGYPNIGELGRFGSEQLGTGFLGKNGVSLTLGLPHCEQNYNPNQNLSTIEMGNVEAHYNCINGNTNSQPSHSSVAFENLNIPSRKRFAAQLLPDFVA